jgi:hypothetical protein
LTDDVLDFEDFMHALPTGSGTVSLAEVAREQDKVLSLFDGLDPLRLAATFAGLLTTPDLQSNCIRLESLVHLSLALCNGRRKPSDKIVARLFSEFGKRSLGMQEDPAEDVFVSLIRTRRGNFRILEGIWESAGFELQRTVDALERIPSQARFDHIRNSVYALLRLSEAVCVRAKLARYQLGNEIPQEVLPGKIAASLSSLRRIVRFHEGDLSELGIFPDKLAEFGFDPAARSGLARDFIGHSMLERFPVVHRNGDYIFVLPTAVSIAIRRYVIEEMSALGLRDVFASTLAYEHAQLFSETPLLGLDSGAPVEFQKTDDGLLAGAMTAADRGLYINFVFFADTLERFEEGGMMGVYPPGDPAKLDAKIERWIDEAYGEAVKQANFRECLTILIGCGIGRAMTIYKPRKERPNWRLEFLGAPDLVTLSWLRDFKPLSLWRLIDSRDRLASLGIALHNINGLLNIVGWARSLGGHLIPHGDMPDDFGQGDGPKFVMVQQNAIRNVRHGRVALGCTCGSGCRWKMDQCA